MINAFASSALLEAYKKIKFGEIRASTVRRYDTSFKQCMLLLGEECLVSSLMPVDISKMRADLMATRAASTVNSYLTVFYAFLSFIEENSYNERNLRSQLKKLKQPSKDPDPISRDEFMRAKAACRFEQHKNIITLMTYSGIRIGELCALAWEDIDLEREVDLMPPAIEALQNQKALTYMLQMHSVGVELSDKFLRKETLRFIFLPNVTQASTKNPYLAKISLNKMWQRICKCAGIRWSECTGGGCLRSRNPKLTGCRLKWRDWGMLAAKMPQPCPKESENHCNHMIYNMYLGAVQDLDNVLSSTKLLYRPPISDSFRIA